MKKMKHVRPSFHIDAHAVTIVLNQPTFHLKKKLHFMDFLVFQIGVILAFFIIYLHLDVPRYSLGYNFTINFRCCPCARTILQNIMYPDNFYEQLDQSSVRNATC